MMVLYLRDHFLEDHVIHEEEKRVKRIAQIITVLFLWFKAVTFLRPFTKYAHLIKMIGQELEDMKYFITIFGILTIAFSDAFYIQSSN